MTLKNCSNPPASGTNVVVLHQYKRAVLCPSFSSACLKIETFLRVHKLEHVIKDDYQWKGLTWNIPKIVINSDTEHHEPHDCIGLLAEKFNLDIHSGIHECGYVLVIHASVS